MKKGWLLTSFLTLIASVSAYGESTDLYIGNFYIDVNMLTLAVVFCAIFAATAITLSKVKIVKNPAIIAIFFSLFAVYGIYKLQIDVEKFFLDIGLLEFVVKYAIWIFAAAAVFILIKWNLGVVFQFFGTIFLIFSLVGAFSEEIVKNWGAAFAIGAILFIFGIWLRRKEKLTFSQKRKLVKWRQAGRDIGYGMAWSADKIQKGYSNLRDYIKSLRQRNKEDEAEIEKEIDEIEDDAKKHPENREADKIRLARLYGIKNLEKDMDKLTKELEQGYNIAEDLHKRATQLGWTSVKRFERRPNEEIKPEDDWGTRRQKEQLFQRRSKEANEAYKTWYRQYQKNIQMQNILKNMEDRLEELKSKI